MIKINS